MIIAGSRTIKDYETVARVIEEVEWEKEITEVVCGMASGVDDLGRKWARSKGIPVLEMPADWNKHGRSAGPIRNEEMAKDADALILIWDGKSKGSADMLRQAKKHGLKIYGYVVVGRV